MTKLDEPSSLEKLHWIAAEQRHGPEVWRAAWLAAVDRIFEPLCQPMPRAYPGERT